MSRSACCCSAAIFRARRRRASRSWSRSGHARGRRRPARAGSQRFASLDAWAEWLAHTPAWVGAFDFPVRPAARTGRAPGLAAAVAGAHRALRRRWAAPRSARRFAAFCAARPAGGKFAHRATDAPGGSSPSMKWVNPPVAFMLHAGVPRLLAAGAALPGLHAPAGGDGARGAGGLPGPAGARADRPAQLQERRCRAPDAGARWRARATCSPRSRRVHAPRAAAGARRMPQRDQLLADAQGDGSTRCCASCRPPGRRAQRSAGPAMACRRTSIRWKAGSSPPDIVLQADCGLSAARRAAVASTRLKSVAQRDCHATKHMLSMPRDACLMSNRI